MKFARGHCSIHGGFVGGRCPVCSSAPPIFTQTTRARPPILCPVCLGKQTVSAGFYMDGGTSTAREKCRSCNGKGIV